MECLGSRSCNSRIHSGEVVICFTGVSVVGVVLFTAHDVIIRMVMFDSDVICGMVMSDIDVIVRITG